MKRILCILFAVFLLCLYSVNVFAEDPLYSLSLSPDRRIKLEGTTDVVLTLSSQSEMSYSAYHFILTYDTQKLRLESVSGNSQVKDSNGTLTIIGFGENIPIETAITVKFTGKKTGLTEVTLQEGYVDKAGNAADRDAPPVTITDDGKVKITVIKSNTSADWGDSDDDAPSEAAVPHKPQDHSAENPFTGDSNHITLCIVAAVLSLFVLLYTLTIRKKEKNAQNN